MDQEMDVPENEKLCDNEEQSSCDCANIRDDELVKLQDEIAVLKDTVLRKVAESENLRKRLEKEKEDAIKYSNARFAKDLLPVLDNFERVQESYNELSSDDEISSKLKHFVDGVLICEKELISVFKKHGIEKIDITDGCPFDHQYHQAMCEIEDDSLESGTVIKVFQTGYMHNDRLLRPAMVSVSKKS